MDGSMAGRTVLVTGGSRGIGLSIATAFAEAQANVFITSRKGDVLREAAAKLTAEFGRSVGHLAGNAGDPHFPDKCVSKAISQFGTLDVLINNAATNPYQGRLIDIDLPRMTKTAEVNYFAPLIWAQSAWRRGMNRNGGSIINMASVGGVAVSDDIGFYNTTKAALIHLTRHLAWELAPSVRVNAIAPGLIKTDMARALWESEEERLRSQVPLQRLGEPDDIARVAMFLASDQSCYVTGQTLIVDGGAVLRPPL